MINIENLQFTYGKQRIYQDFQLQLQQPGIYGLFGRNGSGKSTLLKLLAGLLFADAGRLQVLGYRPADRKPSFLEQIYVVPEEFHLPNISLPVLEKTHAPFYPRFEREHFEHYSEIFEIPKQQRFAEMSLGQKKKAVIAFALATHTPILLMDEPTNGLDIIGRGQFKSIMSRPEHANRLVMISTHQAHDLETLMSHVLFIDQGKLALSADMATLQRALLLGISEDKTQSSDWIYHEVIGSQWAYVMPNRQQTSQPVNLELLYKALSLNPQAVLAAVQAQREAQ